MPIHNFNLKGLSDNEVIKAREKYGINQLNYKKENTFILYRRLEILKKVM
jgi:Ca2+-transporting ATPase